MATNGCSPVTFCQTFQNAFYFKGKMETADLDEDTFRIGAVNKNCLVRSMDNKFLLLNAESQFQVQNLNSDQLCHPDCKFKIQTYNESPDKNGKGKPAMLYVKRNNKNMVVCCSETQHDIYPEEMDLPSQIEDTKHKALFYMIRCTASNTFRFKSSEHPSGFLGFEPSDDPSLNKLVLRHEKDDSCRICLQFT